MAEGRQCKPFMAIVICFQFPEETKGKDLYRNEMRYFAFISAVDIVAVLCLTVVVSIRMDLAIFIIVLIYMLMIPSESQRVSV